MLPLSRRETGATKVNRVNPALEAKEAFGVPEVPEALGVFRVFKDRRDDQEGTMSPAIGPWSRKSNPGIRSRAVGSRLG